MTGMAEIVKARKDLAQEIQHLHLEVARLQSAVKLLALQPSIPSRMAARTFYRCAVETQRRELADAAADRLVERAVETLKQKQLKQRQGRG
jgi:hypothetical protein